MMGDFNEVQWQIEHFSKKKRAERQMQAFRDALADCELQDIGFQGLPWTYDNKQTAERNVKVRLDRAVATQGWASMHAHHGLHHLVSSRSDHCPILLQLTLSDVANRRGRCQRYEIMWERDASLKDEILSAWRACTNKRDLGGIADTLKGVMQSLNPGAQSSLAQ